MAEDQFTEDALKSQDGKKVPLTLEPGGPVIGEATMEFVPGTGELRAQLRIHDPLVLDFLKGNNPDPLLGGFTIAKSNKES